MRNMFMSALMFLFMASNGISQATTVETLTFRSYDENNQVISELTFEGQEAIELDVSKLIKESQLQERISVRGLFYSDLEVNRIKFDSHNIEDFQFADNFCETVEFKLKPYLGVAAYSTDDMQGVNVERVVETSPAGQAGIQETDVILTFNYLPVGSFCELKMEVENCSVGQTVPVEIIRDGRRYTLDVIIGGQVNNTISFVVCDELTTDLVTKSKEFDSSELNVFPNPTVDIVNLKFISTQHEPAKFYILNFNGAIIHKENVVSETGVVKISYAFSNEPNGNYLFVIEQGEKLFDQQVIYTK